MNVAICFYGQPRKYKQVLDQWQILINELNIDVFIHTWYGKDRGENEIDINELISDFNPKEILTSAPHKFKELIDEECTYENQSYHAMNQAFSISNSFNMMNIHSKLFNKNYDVIIKSRLDINLHNIINLINFIKFNVTQNELYVASNHWQHHLEFDDNIMIGSANLMNEIYSNFFEYTIHKINSTKIIPGGEQNIFRYINSKNLLLNIKKVKNLDFTLLTYNNGEKMILNQNEN